MNSDIIFSPKVISGLIAIMEEDKTIGLTIPMVNDNYGNEQSSYHPLPSPLDLICHRFIPRKLCRKRMDRYEIKVSHMTKPLNVPYVHGCFMMMSTEALSESGIFDERFFMYPEDIDLTRRIHERFQTLVVPYLSIIHNHRATSRHNLKFLWVHISNIVRYFNKWGWFESRPL